MSTVTLAEGSVFGGRYKVVRNIAAGGMGAVYEVLHVETARRRALKVMLPHLVESEELRKRFQAEARIAGQVESAYIVDVFDAGIDETTQMPFLVMELLKGEELGKRLRRVGRFGFEETVGYLWQTALALDKTHKANIVHRDLKPENLFLCEDEDGPPKIKVLDFGIAKFVKDSETQANATRSVGTPLYMAPEQFLSKPVSPATDIYSLGMMAYTLLVGAPYWAEEQATNDNMIAFLMVVAKGMQEPPTARALRRGVKLPAAFDDWFAQATSSQPEQRFFKATVAIMGLANALGVPVPVLAAGHAGGTTGPQGISALLGHAASGQTSPGQTGSGLEGGTMVLREGDSTSASGFGLSSSQPTTGVVTSSPANTGMGVAQAIPARKKGKRAVVAAALVACLMGIGLAVSFGRSTRAQEDPIAVPLPPPVQAARPDVVPVETVNNPGNGDAPPKGSTEGPKPADTKQELNADAGMNAGVGMDAGVVNPPIVKKTPTKNAGGNAGGWVF